MSNRIKNKNKKQKDNWIYMDEKDACRLILMARDLGMTPSECLNKSIIMTYNALIGKSK